MFGQQQQQQQGVPQIFMNPWDPAQPPVMTLAPLANVANAMQAAYHQQMLLQQQVSSHSFPSLRFHFSFLIVLLMSLKDET